MTKLADIDKSIEKKLNKVANEAEKLGRAKASEPSDDEVRGKIARHFVWAFIAVLPVMFLLIMWYNHSLSDKVTPLDVEKILSLVGNFFASSLGFVLGYYFKSQEKK